MNLNDMRCAVKIIDKLRTFHCKLIVCNHNQRSVQRNHFRWIVVSVLFLIRTKFFKRNIMNAYDTRVPFGCCVSENKTKKKTNGYEKLRVRHVLFRLWILIRTQFFGSIRLCCRWIILFNIWFIYVNGWCRCIGNLSMTIT